MTGPRFLFHKQGSLSTLLWCISFKFQAYKIEKLFKDRNQPEPHFFMLCCVFLLKTFDGDIAVGSLKVKKPIVNNKYDDLGEYG